jgi:hypothetical protein
MLCRVTLSTPPEPRPRCMSMSRPAETRRRESETRERQRESMLNAPAETRASMFSFCVVGGCSAYKGKMLHARQTAHPTNCN